MGRKYNNVNQYEPSAKFVLQVPESTMFNGQKSSKICSVTSVGEMWRSMPSTKWIGRGLIERGEA